LNTSNLKCIASNGQIQIIGVEVGKQIEIYNIMGQKVKSVTASENTFIPLANTGIYLIKVDTIVQKVFLK